VSKGYIVKWNWWSFLKNIAVENYVALLLARVRFKQKFFSPMLIDYQLNAVTQADKSLLRRLM
jgi:hypothetical protein